MLQYLTVIAYKCTRTAHCSLLGISTTELYWISEKRFVLQRFEDSNYTQKQYPTQMFSIQGER